MAEIDFQVRDDEYVTYSFAYSVAVLKISFVYENRRFLYSYLSELL